MAKQIKPVINEFQPVTQGNLRGLFSVQVDPCEYRKCRLIQQPNSSPFCSPPQESYTDRDGKRKYVTLVRWPSEWNEAILAAMLDAQQQHPDGIRRQTPPSDFHTALRAKAGIGGGDR